jgi:adenosylcobinamide-GDP ribazoletransferase
VISAVLYAVLYGCKTFAISPALFAVLAVAVPVLITGGLHLDGFCDTSDALSSQKDREEKLRILKDPHVGAFAVIYTFTVLLLQFGAWYQLFLTPVYILPVLISFVLSRILISLAVVTFPCARDSGLASIFAGYASKKAVRNCLILYLLVCAVTMIFFHPLGGAVIMAGVLLSFLWFRTMVNHQFGGITGDLAGFYLVICETGVLLIAAGLGGILQ